MNFIGSRSALVAISTVACIAPFLTFAGSFPENYFRADAGIASPATTSLPNRFDVPELLAWRVPLDPGHSSPIVHQGKIFLTTYRAGANELATLALDAKTGETIWRRPIQVTQVEQTHAIGSPATATPACSSERIFVFFGSHGLVCYNLDGRKLWEHLLGPFQDEYGAGSSPVLFEDKLFLNQDHDRDSFLAAFNVSDGKIIWKVARPEAVRSYSTPALWKRDGRPELLVAGALTLTAYDPANGEKIWWIDGLARIVIPAPVPAAPMVYMASWAPGADAGTRLSLDPWAGALAKWDKNRDQKLTRPEVDDREVLERFYRMDLDQNGALDQTEWDRHAEVFRLAQNALLAVKPSGRGHLPQSAVAWKYTRGVPYVSTPLLAQGILWMVKAGGIVTKLQTATGQVLQEERLPSTGNYFASPVSGDGKVYFASEPGVVSVVAASPAWQVISCYDFREKIYATPLLHDNRVYIRTEQALYCFRTGDERAAKPNEANRNSSR